MTKIVDFRRRKHADWTRPSEVEGQGKRLKGLDEFVKPQFVGRMERVREQRERLFLAMLIAAILLGAAIGWTLV